MKMTGVFAGPITLCSITFHGGSAGHKRSAAIASVSTCQRAKLILSFTAFITTLLKNVSTDLWVGLTSDSKGHFKWTKTALLSYTNWAPGEPIDNSGPHHNKTPVFPVFFITFMPLSLVCCCSDCFAAASGKLCGDDSRQPREENWDVGLPSL
ncbi:hypothetical protein XENOCAPTIV_028966 [Xenoophorus captivus]|uniref:C-type lectin domain-containing protein n=1 Tax=Xenoophorus captivus TaxID=1517983 RepID=A0ABV0S3R3_9TELE